MWENPVKTVLAILFVLSMLGFWFLCSETIEFAKIVNINFPSYQITDVIDD